MVTDFEFNSLNDILYFYGIDEKASMLFTETDDTVDIMDEYLEELNLDPGLDTVEEFHVFYDTVDEQLKGILTYDTRKLDEVSDLVFASRYVPVDAVWRDLRIGACCDQCPRRSFKKGCSYHCGTYWDVS